jgi:hypothetical protein
MRRRLIYIIASLVGSIGLVFKIKKLSGRSLRPKVSIGRMDFNFEGGRGLVHHFWERRFIHWGVALGFLIMVLGTGLHKRGILMTLGLLGLLGGGGFGKVCLNLILRRFIDF